MECIREENLPEFRQPHIVQHKSDAFTWIALDLDLETNPDIVRFQTGKFILPSEDRKRGSPQRSPAAPRPLRWDSESAKAAQ